MPSHTLRAYRIVYINIMPIWLKAKADFPWLMEPHDGFRSLKPCAMRKGAIVRLIKPQHAIGDSDAGPDELSEARWRTKDECASSRNEAFKNFL
jgi:hypothetical protein